MRLARLAACGAATLLAGCGGGAKSTHTSAASVTTAAPPPPGVTTGVKLASGFSLASSAFKAGAAIPSRYTCDGADISLPLRWSGVPRGTAELVLVMRDPDAPTGNFVHWALAGIPASTNALSSGSLPGRVTPGRNTFGTLGYRGPCPPRGAAPHHYVLTLSALSARTGLGPGFSADQLRTSALGIATLIGTYARG